MIFQRIRILKSDRAVLLAAAIVLLGLLAWIFCNPNEICCDCAIGLEWGQQLLNGARPYVDACELDPPMLGYLSLLPAALAALTHMPLVLSFSLSVWWACVCSKLVVYGLFAAAQSPISTRRWAAPLVLAACVFDLALLNLQGDLMLGQREHMVIVFFLPFFVLRFLRYNGGSRTGKYWAAACGVAASALICLKHYFILLPASVELFWLLRTRRFRELLRPEVVSAVVFAGLYALHFVVFKDLREHFLYCWVPVLLAGYAYSSFPLYPMFCITLYVKGYPELLICSSSFAALTARRCKLVVPLLLFSWAGYLIYMWQAKSWSYQAIPCIFAFYLSFVLSCLVLLLRVCKHRHRAALAIVSAASFAVIVFGILHLEFLNWELEYRDDPDPRIAALIKVKTNPGDPVLVLSTSPGNAYPMLVKLRRSPGSRYPYEYGIDLFSFIRSEQVSSKSLTGPLVMTEKRFVEEIASDIKTRRPRLVLIRGDAQIRPRSEIVVYDYIKHCPEIMDALKPYKPLGFVGGMWFFELPSSSRLKTLPESH